MGKGDKRSRKGKRIAGSWGVYRPRRIGGTYVVTDEDRKKKAAKKTAETKPKKAPKKKAAPVAKPVVEKVMVAEAPVVVVKQSPEKKEAPKKEAKPKAEKKAKAESKPKAEKAKPAQKGGKDDLKKIEGIGPATEKVFAEAGINTFAELAAASVDSLKEILAAKGSRYKLLDPGTWPEQSALAAEDKWDDLKTLQDTLDKGKRKS